MHNEIPVIDCEAFSLLADRLASIIHAHVASNGYCHIVFHGGGTLRLILEQLINIELPWPALYLYPSDDRCVPLGHSERNDHLIGEVLLSQMRLASEHFHRIPAESGPEEGALRYS